MPMEGAMFSQNFDQIFGRGRVPSADFPGIVGIT
jgi:hypothetical protein